MKTESTIPYLADAVLSVNDTMTSDQVLEIRERVLFAKAKLKELEQTLEEGLI